MIDTSGEMKKLEDLQGSVEDGGTVCTYPSDYESYWVMKKNGVYMGLYDTVEVRKSIEAENYKDLLYAMYMMLECDCIESPVWSLPCCELELCPTCELHSIMAGVVDDRCFYCRQALIRQKFESLLGDIEIDL
jgi:hypothetical protein